MDTNNDILSAADVERIVTHMNADHADSILAYVHHYGALSSASQAKLLTVTELAMEIEALVDGENRIVVIPFSSPLRSAKHAHVAMVQMSKEAKKSFSCGMNSKPGSSRYTFADIASFPAASASRLRYCFHTAEDGRIPITNEWPIALAAFAEYAHTYVQVEHDYGQMSVRMTRSEFVDSLVDKPQTTYLKLQAEFTDWHRAWGRLGICNCCGSPGRVTFHNCCGGNFLQISPESGTDLQGWAQFLSGIAVQFDGNSLDSDPVAATADYVLLPQEAKALKLSPDGFFHLLRLMRARGEVLEFSLPRKESSLHNQFVLEGVHLEGGQLIGKGIGVGFVLNLAAVCGYATVNTEAGQELLVIGPEERVLFSVTHHQSSVPQAFWESALVEIV